MAPEPVSRSSSPSPDRGAAVIIDTHCHLTHARFAADRDDVITGLAFQNVAKVMTIGTSIADGRVARGIARQYPDRVACSVGLDPFACNAVGIAGFPAAFSELEALLNEGGFSAVGEIGLEYHHPLLPHDVQAEHFSRQLDLARAHDLPAVLHIRDAHDDAIRLLRARWQEQRKNPEENLKSPGVVHSFIGTTEEARAYLEMGWHLAFNGVVTYKANDFLRAAVKIVPENRLLVETDSPYLAPVPMRGKRCEPVHTWHTVDLIAQERGQTPAAVAAATTANARRLFRW
jgi:TatD DNase family protein